MRRVRLLMAVPTAAALVLAVLFGYVVSEPDSVHGTDVRSDGGSCGSYSGGTSRTMTATVVVRNDSATSVRILGIRAATTAGRGSVRYAVVPGRALRAGFEDLDGIRARTRVVDAVGATLPARSSSSLLMTMTVAAGADFVAVDGVSVARAGRLGVLRTDTVTRSGIGVGAPGSDLATCTSAFDR